MQNMVYYTTDKNGKIWFICRDCGNKEHFQFTFCPVCKNEREHQNPEFRSALKTIIANAIKERV